MLYANLMMGFVLSFHPMTFMLAWFFWAQVPVQLMLDTVVYPIFPQFDQPYIPWVQFVEFLLGFPSAEGDAPEEA